MLYARLTQSDILYGDYQLNYKPLFKSNSLSGHTIFITITTLFIHIAHVSYVVVVFSFFFFFFFLVFSFVVREDIAVEVLSAEEDQIP